MTIELVDGKAGTAHISSEDKAIIHQSKFGASDMVYAWGDALKCTMGSANKATIGTGCASIQGLDWHITAAETVQIDNGSQGMKRNDIIAAHYNRDSTSGIEKVELVVLKGTPNATTAADPTIPDGKILSGATDAYQPLWRIPLDGITVGTPVALFSTRNALWDSVTHLDKLQSQIDNLGVRQVSTGLYVGSSDSNGYIMIANPFKSTSIAVFASLSPNGMIDQGAKLFSVFTWDVNASRMRLRIRREDSNKWIDSQPVRVQWIAVRTS